MDLQLKDKTVFVSGSTSGIGFFLAKGFKDQGCEVILNGRDQQKLEKACSELGGVEGILADMTKNEDVEKIQKYFSAKKLDVLVANVGSGGSVPPGSETLEEWKRVFDLNLFSSTTLIEKLYPSIKSSKGNIVCISSICGLEALGAPLTYSAAKAALNSFVNGFSRYCGPDGIRINAIAPGNILFEGSVWDRKLQENREQVEQMLKTSVPLQRLGRPEEVADLACFIASEKTAFMTGKIVVLDGGQVRS